MGTKHYEPFNTKTQCGKAQKNKEGKRRRLKKSKIENYAHFL